jgi:hypothetical protein
MRRSWRAVTVQALVPTVLLGLAVSGCEPASLTDARDQLARGPADTVRYVLPLARDTFDISDLELTQDTVIGDLLAVALDQETVTYAVAEDLAFENLTLTALDISFPPPVLQAPAGTVVDTGLVYSGLSSEVRLDGIDSLRALTGTLKLQTSNRLVESVDYTLVLGGFIDAAGDTLRLTGTIPAASGDGSYASDVQTIDLAGVTIVPGEAWIRVNVTLTLSGSPLNAVNAASAIVQTGTADFEVAWLQGPLDPDVTPELTIAIEDFTEVPESSLDALGDFKDLLEVVTLETAEGRLTFTNTSGTPIEISEFTVGVVALTATGGVPTDPTTGDPEYEKDDQGNPLVIDVPSPGGTTVLERNGGAVVTVAFPALVDRVVKLLLNGERAALLGTGVATAGDGQESTLLRSDSVVVAIDVVVGVDATIPVTGAMYPPGNQINEGMGLDAEDADDVIENLLVRAAAGAEVVNETPYELEVTLAFIDGDRGATDVTTLPGAVILSPVRVAAAVVGADGRVVAPVVDTVETGIAADQIGPLLGDMYTVTVKATLFPGAGGNGRAALGVDDRAIVGSTVILDLKRGGKAP